MWIIIIRTFSNIKPATVCSNDKLDIEQPWIPPILSSAASTYYDNNSCSSNKTISSQQSCETPSFHMHDTEILENNSMKNAKPQNFKSETAHTALKRTSDKSNTNVKESNNMQAQNICKGNASVKVSQSSGMNIFALYKMFYTCNILFSISYSVSCL